MFLKNAIERLEELRDRDLEKLATEVLRKIKDNPNSSLDDLWDTARFKELAIPTDLEVKIWEKITHHPDYHLSSFRSRSVLDPRDLKSYALIKALGHFDDGASVDCLWKMVEFFKRSGETGLAMDASKKVIEASKKVIYRLDASYGDLRQAAYVLEELVQPGSNLELRLLAIEAWKKVIEHPSASPYDLTRVANALGRVTTRHDLIEQAWQKVIDHPDASLSEKEIANKAMERY